MLEEPGAGISPGLRCPQLGKGGRVTQGRAQWEGIQASRAGGAELACLAPSGAGG